MLATFFAEEKIEYFGVLPFSACRLRRPDIIERKGISSESIESARSRVSNRQNPYNVFTAWKMSENDHTKMFLALMRYQNASGRYAYRGKYYKY